MEKDRNKIHSNSVKRALEEGQFHHQFKVRDTTLWEARDRWHFPVGNAQRSTVSSAGCEEVHGISPTRCTAPLAVTVH